MSFQFLGNFLVEHGIVSREQVDEACAFQSEANRRLGEFAVEAGLLTPEQVEDILRRQRHTGRSFGGLAVSLGYVAKRDMDALLFRQNVHQVHLGEALLILGHLDTERFSRAMDRYMVQERQRLLGLEALYGQGQAGTALKLLAESMELAFLRFAGCHLKAHGEIDLQALERFPHRRDCSVALPDGSALRFTLYLDDAMRVGLFGQEGGIDGPEREAHVLEVVSSYLREAWPPCAAPAGSPACREPLCVRLACPNAQAAVSLRVH